MRPTTAPDRRVPELLVLTDRAVTDRPLPDVVGAAVEGGARAVLLREKDLPTERRRELAAALRPILDTVDGLLLVASDPQVAADPDVAADGVHLAARDPLPAGSSRPTLLGRSCHDLDEVHRAAAEGCDYVTLSPVFETASKPGHGPALGIAALRDAAAAVTIPVLGLGGIDPSTARALALAGHRHVAVMGAVMRAPDPAAVVAELRAAIAAVPAGTGGGAGDRSRR